MTQTLVVSIQLRIRSKKYAAKICRIKSIHGLFVLGVEMVYKEHRGKLSRCNIMRSTFQLIFFFTESGATRDEA